MAICNVLFAFAGIAPTSTEKFDINQYIENSIATFKLKIHQAAQRHEWKLRRRRSVEIFNSTYTRGEENVFFERLVKFVF